MFGAECFEIIEKLALKMLGAKAPIDFHRVVIYPDDGNVFMQFTGTKLGCR